MSHAIGEFVVAIAAAHCAWHAEALACALRARFKREMLRLAMSSRRFCRETNGQHDLGVGDEGAEGAEGAEGVEGDEGAAGVMCTQQPVSEPSSLLLL